MFVVELQEEYVNKAKVSVVHAKKSHTNIILVMSNLTPGKIQADIDDIDLILIIELRTLLYIIIYLSHV